ncbi:MAG: class I SAM-dependent methyltransferase [Anaerolineaceae bacterium]
MKQTIEAETPSDKHLEWFLKEYESENVLSRFLLNNLFENIGKIKPFLPPSARLLEVGCGLGVSSLRIHSMLPDFEMEVSEFDEIYVQKMLASNFPLKVNLESVLDLKRENGSFDCVFFLEVLEHIEDYEKALSELFRISSRYVVISVPNEPLWRILNMARGKYLRNFGNTPGHINHWSSPAFLKLISKFGAIRQIQYPLPWLVVIAEVRP